jgi:hypothetical protein
MAEGPMLTLPRDGVVRIGVDQNGNTCLIWYDLKFKIVQKDKPLNALWWRDQP